MHTEISRPGKQTKLLSNIRLGNLRVECRLGNPRFQDTQRQLIPDQPFMIYAAKEVEEPIVSLPRQNTAKTTKVLPGAWPSF